MTAPAFPPTTGSRLDATKMRRISLASMVGTTVEWYDLFLFGTASALVFGKVFFPEFDGAVGTILSFLTFASAYLARMVGAVLFGHFGDRLGRKSMLLISLTTMGVATFAIGLVPGYATLGVAAPLLLLGLRVVQGLALGGEWGGAVLMTVEHAPENRRGFFGSMVQIGVPIGTLLANGAFLLVASTTSSDALYSWGWRIPFLASAILVGIGFYIRLHIEETPSFQAVREEGVKARIPFFALMSRYWRQVLLGGVATLSTGSTFTLMVASGVSYGTNDLGHSKNLMLWAVMVACAIAFLAIPYFGRLSDRVGRKPVIYAGIAAEAVLAFPFFWLLDTGSALGVFVAYTLMMLAFSANYGPIATFLAELFGTRVRYSGLSVAYMLSGLLGSAATPAVTAWLLSATGSSSSIAWYVLGAASLSLLALLLLAETRFGDIDEPGVESRSAARPIGAVA
ncbi:MULTISPECIES: MFS transporter [unclassified Streptomyces]|uniref:MFS transporter n=1 Tax=unclassified Streptomyces TaxID=2593676 RepID=UPI00224F2E6A|nr:MULTISPECIES: MFS transporter [unclassified Streptomyces]WSP55633.1 MHS family MFS transporter [Streptomyces sp. NBC_01241]WSU23629.1 MHS family MFS transporter [Streptomyces sp. NBC_01108]MCX4787330.1 MHS family MFS transporter [Streptomyces sp. NBC_01221]MCX4796885.1 MHS family MFS transporter [Streptomyces sp. NBC_01242]WSJ38098.1 MHS family MFS transporter [Streptomyces sp. NBC_01321]